MDKQRRWIYKLLPRAFLPKPIEGDMASAAPMPVIVKAADGKQQDKGEHEVFAISDGIVACPKPGGYRSYPERWWLLLTVVLLNLANYSHWVAFPSVTKMTAQYYDQPGERMDLIPTVSYGLGVPFCIIATYVVERFGLKVGLHIGGVLTGIGGLMCFLSSLYGISDGLTNDSKFYLALLGQAMTGIACPFISCIPTKVSQLWFGEEQRTLATILVGMSNPMGLVLGSAITPLIVTSPDRVPIMNIVWFVPAAFGALLTMWKVTRNRPPTPPSLSAQQQGLTKPTNASYLRNIRSLMTNVPFFLGFLFVGGAMGYVSTISTKIEQILCARGYSDQLSGMSNSLILLVGTMASFPFGVLAYKTGRMITICKVCCCFVALAICVLSYLMRIPDQGVAIAICCSVIGFFALGVYPLGLELIVECTYPIDQATSTALIFLSSALQGVLLMQVENYFGSPLTEEEMQIQSCVDVSNGDAHGHQQPKDYSAYLNFVAIYMVVLIAIFVVFFKTEMKRTKADKATVASSSGSSGGEVAASNTNSTKVQKESQEDNDDLEGGALLEEKE